MAMEIIEPGLLTTVQDMGRTGCGALGYSTNGACDKYSMKLANLLVGNTDKMEQAAVLEFTMKGGVIRFTSSYVLALAGADMAPVMNGNPVPMYAPVPVKAGDILILGMALSGMRCYLAVRGGIGVPLIMGSRSTDLKCHLGGYGGRALKKGDVLEAGPEQGDAAGWDLLPGENGLRFLAGEDEPWFRIPSSHYSYRGMERRLVLRTVPGPQEEAFTPYGIETFTHSNYCLSHQCDRMACRLTGPAVETKGGSDMISDGIVEGSVQISSDGMPMIMMADHQTTGGYAKIGTVVSTDIPALAQLKPGDGVVFRFISVEEGIEACRKEYRKIQWLKERMCME